MFRTGETGRAEHILFTPGESWGLQLRVDYRKMNAISLQDSYIVLGMDECIDFLGDVAILSNLEANSRYQQVEVIDEDRDETGFAPHYKAFSFTQMLFGQNGTRTGLVHDGHYTVLG